MLLLILNCHKSPKDYIIMFLFSWIKFIRPPLGPDRTGDLAIHSSAPLSLKMADMDEGSSEPSPVSTPCLEPLTPPDSTPREAGSKEDDGSVRVTMDMMISGRRLYDGQWPCNDRCSIGHFIGICKNALEVQEETISFVIGLRRFNVDDANARIMLLDVSKECIQRDGCLSIKVILAEV